MRVRVRVRVVDLIHVYASSLRSYVVACVRVWLLIPVLLVRVPLLELPVLLVRAPLVELPECAVVCVPVCVVRAPLLELPVLLVRAPLLELPECAVVRVPVCVVRVPLHCVCFFLEVLDLGVAILPLLLLRLFVHAHVQVVLSAVVMFHLVVHGSVP